MDISRFTDSWAAIYICPHHPPKIATKIPGPRKTGVKYTTALNLTSMAIVISESHHNPLEMGPSTSVIGMSGYEMGDLWL